MNPYETRRYLAEYLLFHYGSPRELCPYPFAPKAAFHFHRRIVRECLLPLHFSSPTRGLDLGCAVGGLTHELAKVVDEATGIDNSRQFIRAARQHTKSRHIKFRVGDAMTVTGQYHVVLAVNLICRLPTPRQFLAHLPELVHSEIGRAHV